LSEPWYSPTIDPNADRARQLHIPRKRGIDRSALDDGVTRLFPERLQAWFPYMLAYLYRAFGHTQSWGGRKCNIRSRSGSIMSDTTRRLFGRDAARYAQGIVTLLRVFCSGVAAPEGGCRTLPARGNCQLRSTIRSKVSTVDSCCIPCRDPSPFHVPRLHRVHCFWNSADRSSPRSTRDL